MPAGVVNLVLGPGERVGQALADSPRRRHGVADRRARRRPVAAARRGRQHQAGRPRARRQEPQHHLRRRRLRDRRRQRADRRVRPLRPGLLGRLPGDRPGRDLRPVRGRGRPARRADPAGCRDRIPRPRRGRSSRPRIGPRWRATWRWAIAEGARLVAGGGPPTEPELAAGLLLPPDGAGRLPARHDGHPRGDLRAGADRRAVLDRGRGVELGNDTTYGLAGAVWTADAGRAQRVAARLRHGTVWINDYNTYLPQAEWGGFKQSGIGRELGPSGLDEYRETKHIWQNLSPAPDGLVRGLRRGPFGPVTCGAGSCGPCGGCSRSRRGRGEVARPGCRRGEPRQLRVGSNGQIPRRR